MKARERLESGIAQSKVHEKGIAWEVNRLTRALRGVDCPVVLLKGGAYVMANLPAGRGRLVSDLDILVPRERLDEVEKTLLTHGWEYLKEDEYDDRYYRNWTHELPPLRHRDRLFMLDVHHSILPPLGNLKPDPLLLIAAARPIRDSRFLVLCPEDMVLHSAAHLFQDGEMAGGVRDLTDLDLLFRHFDAEEPGFWERLVPRAEQLHLTRPLYYASRYTRRLLETPIPASVKVAIDRFMPITPIRFTMDSLTNRALIPPDADTHRWDIELANLLLLIRGHWLKMPLPILARHLTHKALRPWHRWRKAANAKEG